MLSLSMVAVLHRRISPDECKIWGGRQHHIYPPHRGWRLQYSIVGIKIPQYSRCG